jgi:streptogramin lyase
VGHRGFIGSVSLPPGSQEVAACNGFLWVTNNAGTLTQINPYTVRPVKTYQLGHPAYGVACTPNNIWVSVTSP